MKKDARYLLAKKQSERKITMLTCYDYPTALLEDRAGIDIILVGDSVGTNILGYESEAQVTLEDIIHHLKAVRRGVSQAYLLADLPYGTYDTPEKALDSAQKLLFYGADGVKLEGFKQEVITHLVNNGIEVCGHLGLLPQTHTKKAVRGKSFDEAKEIIEGALILEKIGVFMLLFELIPEEVAKIITEKVKVPTIGIGAGRFTDGQVLIINDILGITPRQLKLAKKYQDYQSLTSEAIAHYKEDVEQTLFPTRENIRPMPEAELKQLAQWVQREFGVRS
jgi:3-methyl-2-oxobutanoate hydroxymethyltransferase